MPRARLLVLRQFSKTELCKFKAKGFCRNGVSCNFAHSKEEMNSRPCLSKTKICESFQVGRCTEGDSCRFAHSMEELRSTAVFYKTVMCNDYVRSGFCAMGPGCRFAHGLEELAPIEDLEPLAVMEEPPKIPSYFPSRKGNKMPAFAGARDGLHPLGAPLPEMLFPPDTPWQHSHDAAMVHSHDAAMVPLPTKLLPCLSNASDVTSTADSGSAFGDSSDNPEQPPVEGRLPAGDVDNLESVLALEEFLQQAALE